MPVVRVEIPESTPVEIAAELRRRVRAAVERTLAPKEVKYEYVAVRRVLAELGDGVPAVTVDLRPGRGAERKAALVRQLEVIFEELMQSPPRDLYVLFREVDAANHYCGGEPLPPWVPADQRDPPR